ncbi:NUMOD4 motif-containing HNH endonuclease [Beijerinckia sp. L45]|uniref:NUMOD4 motif-containing HNH endonuclease n=1 Tax=Beijerinckia sp. L45 TaxID=1641855 RepID=UPI00131BA47F|nr:NUMOD4 motif-containing HNH endonuclease [Beijerinckia sp. L45]
MDDTIYCFDDYTNEVWKEVVGFEGYYEVSDMGRVRSVTRLVTQFNPKIGRDVSWTRIGKIMKPRRSTSEGRLKYFGLTLWKDGKRVDRAVHTLVMQAFVGPRPDGCEIAHRSGDPTDNRLTELRYTTHIDNCNDRRAHGTEAIGERNPSAKLCEMDILMIRCNAAGLTVRELAAQHKVSRSAIYAAQSGQSWSHI